MSSSREFQPPIRTGLDPKKPAAATMPESEFAALERRARDNAARLGDSFIVAMQDYSTEELRDIADYREAINPGCWFARCIREYVSVWR